MRIALLLPKLLIPFLICFAVMTLVPLELVATENQHCRTSIRHIEGGGIGYKKGYTTLEAFFAPDPVSLDWMPFLDVRGHIFDDAKGAANAGVGLRKIAGHRVYGLNVYYDYRTAKKIRYNQMGFGLETLGKLWDFRINGYLPLGKTITPISDPVFAGFSGNQMKVNQNFRFAMNGANAELGFHLGDYHSFDFYTAAGPYFFMGKIGHKVWGGKVRLVGQYKEYVKLELSNSYDATFRNRFQCQLTLTMPFGGQSHTEQSDWGSYALSDVLFSRIIQPVERQEIIVSYCAQDCSVARDCATGKPVNFVFVNNTSHSEGTYESPYPTLLEAQTNSSIRDIIYVFPGDGTTKGMDQGITLKSNQKFWGSAFNHSLQTTQGDVNIPAQSSSSPKITALNFNDCIKLAQANEVSGFILKNIDGNGIIGINVTSIDISDCSIDASLEDHIHIECAGKTGSATFTRLALSNGNQNGIFIDASTSSIACTVDNCFFQGNNLYSVNASLDQPSNFNMTSNTFEGNVNGSLFNFNGESTLVASGNTFKGTTSVSSPPLTIIAQTSPLSVTITDNTMSQNECGSIHFQLNNTDSAQFTVSNNTFADNATGSIGSLGSSILMNPNNTTESKCQLNLVDNTFSSNAGSAVYCSNGSFNDLQINATGNTIVANDGAGFVFNNPCTTFAFNATNNIISNGGDNAVTTAGGITLAQADIVVSNNQITNNANSASGLSLNHDGANLNLVVTDNDISDNATSAIILFASTGIDNVTVDIANNTMNNNQNQGSNQTGGIDLEQFINFSGSITNNTFSGNTGPGVYIGSTQATPVACLDLNGNVSDTGYTLSSGSGVFNLAPCNANAANTGVITALGIITPVQSCPDGAACPP